MSTRPTYSSTSPRTNKTTPSYSMSTHTSEWVSPAVGVEGRLSRWCVNELDGYWFLHTISQAEKKKTTSRNRKPLFIYWGTSLFSVIFWTNQQHSVLWTWSLLLPRQGTWTLPWYRVTWSLGTWGWRCAGRYSSWCYWRRSGRIKPRLAGHRSLVTSSLPCLRSVAAKSSDENGRGLWVLFLEGKVLIFLCWRKISSGELSLVFDLDLHVFSFETLNVWKINRRIIISSPYDCSTSQRHWKKTSVSCKILYINIGCIITAVTSSVKKDCLAVLINQNNTPIILLWPCMGL